jgi:hypothetical protein
VTSLIGRLLPPGGVFFKHRDALPILTAEAAEETLWFFRVVVQQRFCALCGEKTKALMAEAGHVGKHQNGLLVHNPDFGYNRAQATQIVVTQPAIQPPKEFSL